MKGIVKSLALSHKNGRKIFRPGDNVSENDVNNFVNLCKSGAIEMDSDSKKKLEKKEKEAVEKAEAKRKEAEKARIEAANANKSAVVTIESLEAEKATLTKENEGLKSKIESLEAEKATFENDKTELSNKIKGFELQISKLKKASESK